MPYFVQGCIESLFHIREHLLKILNTFQSSLDSTPRSIYYNSSQTLCFIGWARILYIQPKQIKIQKIIKLNNEQKLTFIVLELEKRCLEFQRFETSSSLVTHRERKVVQSCWKVWIAQLKEFLDSLQVRWLESTKV